MSLDISSFSLSIILSVYLSVTVYLTIPLSFSIIYIYFRSVRLPISLSLSLSLSLYLPTSLSPSSLPAISSLYCSLLHPYNSNKSNLRVSGPKTTMFRKKMIQISNHFFKFKINVFYEGSFLCFCSNTLLAIFKFFIHF